MDPRETIRTAIIRCVKATYGLDITGVELTRPGLDLGDFATNTAFHLAKQLSKPPLALAEELADQLEDEAIAETSAAAPGFINIRLSDEYWQEYLSSISGDYLRSSFGKGEKVQVEYISANPTGPLTLGNARGGFIGDVLSNVLDFQGYDVTREYYFNDAGTQIGKLVESYQAHSDGRVDDDTPYRGEYMQELVQDKTLSNGVEGKSGSDVGAALTSYIFETYIKPALEAASINFDCYTNEGLISQGFSTVRSLLEAQGLISEKEGALWLMSTKFGDERDRVLIKSTGDYTYLANDLAYHHNIFLERSFDRAIKIWGSDHAGQVPSLRLTVKQLFPGKEIDFLIVQWVRLIKDGQEFKISKRAGTYVTVDELIDRVGADVARWFMLMRSNDTHMDFDLDLAAEQSQKNPFWYVMYAYVRLNSILREADESGLKSGSAAGQLSPTERQAVVHLSELPGLLELISSSYEVHKLAFYGQELARIFHEWYEQERVIAMPPKQAAEKLYFLNQLKHVFESYFAIMGITPKEMM